MSVVLKEKKMHMGHNGSASVLYELGVQYIVILNKDVFLVNKVTVHLMAPVTLNKKKRDQLKCPSNTFCTCSVQSELFISPSSLKFIYKTRFYEKIYLFIHFTKSGWHFKPH